MSLAKSFVRSEFDFTQSLDFLLNSWRGLTFSSASIIFLPAIFVSLSSPQSNA